MSVIPTLMNGSSPRPGADAPFPSYAPPDQRPRELEADVAARLRRACADMPVTEFSALVQEIVERKLRWEADDRQPK